MPLDAITERCLLHGIEWFVLLSIADHHGESSIDTKHRKDEENQDWANDVQKRPFGGVYGNSYNFGKRPFGPVYGGGDNVGKRPFGGSYGGGFDIGKRPFGSSYGDGFDIGKRPFGGSYSGGFDIGKRPFGGSYGDGFSIGKRPFGGSYGGGFDIGKRPFDGAYGDEFDVGKRPFGSTYGNFQFGKRPFGSYGGSFKIGKRPFGSTYGNFQFGKRPFGSYGGSFKIGKRPFGSYSSGSFGFGKQGIADDAVSNFDDEEYSLEKRPFSIGGYHGKRNADHEVIGNEYANDLGIYNSDILPPFKRPFTFGDGPFSFGKRNKNILLEDKYKIKPEKQFMGMEPYVLFKPFDQGITVLEKRPFVLGNFKFGKRPFSLSPSKGYSLGKRTVGPLGELRKRPFTLGGFGGFNAGKRPFTSGSGFGVGKRPFVLGGFNFGQRPFTFGGFGKRSRSSNDIAELLEYETGMEKRPHVGTYRDEYDVWA